LLFIHFRINKILLKHINKTEKGISPKALEFTILTACHSGEIFGAKWQEIDFKNKVWIIPKEQMKAEKEHRVPLSKGVISLLKSIQEHIQPQDFIFPAPHSGEMLYDMSLTTLIKRMHEQKQKENGLGYIDPKQNRVITTHGQHSVIGLLIKLITYLKCMNISSLTSYLMKQKLLTYVKLIWKNVRA